MKTYWTGPGQLKPKAAPEPATIIIRSKPTAKPAPKPTTTKPQAKPSLESLLAGVQPHYRTVAVAILAMGRLAMENHGKDLTNEDHNAQNTVRKERFRRGEYGDGPFYQFIVAHRRARNAKSNTEAVAEMTTAAAELLSLLSKPEGPEAA